MKDEKRERETGKGRKVDISRETRSREEITRAERQVGLRQKRRDNCRHIEGG